MTASLAAISIPILLPWTLFVLLQEIVIPTIFITKKSYTSCLLEDFTLLALDCWIVVEANIDIFWLK